MINILAQFLPIILIFFIVSNNNTLFEFSNTILGKFIAVCIILFYISIDTIIGLFVCALIILFYQSQYKENMDIIYSDFDNNNDYNGYMNSNIDIDIDIDNLNNDIIDNNYLDDEYIDEYIYLYHKEENNTKKK